MAKKKYQPGLTEANKEEWKIEHRPPVKNTDPSVRKPPARAYSFSMEPALYNRLSKYCKERQVNMSALVRRLIYIQLRDWALGANDLAFLEKTQMRKMEQAKKQLDQED